MPGDDPGACWAMDRASGICLIEYLHLIQDEFGQISAAHLAALADEMRAVLCRGVRDGDLLCAFRCREGG